MVGMLRRFRKLRSTNAWKATDAWARGPQLQFRSQADDPGASSKGLLGTGRRLYTPEAFLERYFKIYEYPEFRQRRAAIVAKTKEHKVLRTLVYGLILTWNLFRTLVKYKSLKTVGTVYWRYFWEHRRRYQKGITGYTQFVNRCVAHWHFWKFTEEGTNGRLRMFNSG